MMPVSQPDIGYAESPQVCASADSPSQDPIIPSDSPDVETLSIRLPTRASTDTGLAGQTQALQVFAEEPRSLDLCLYALLGFGLCKSAPWVRKLSFTCVPEWYHDGAPLQIGHSHVTSPDCLCTAAVCFVQPDATVEDYLPRYSRGGIVSLVRKSPSVPAPRAPRGPPDLS